MGKLFPIAASKKIMFKSGVYAITPSGWEAKRLLSTLELVLRAGVSVVQYRDKKRDSKELISLAYQVVSLCHEHNIPCIINDDVELAEKVGADGVHVGRDDGAVSASRSYLGAGKIVGASCYGEKKLAALAIQEGADYVAFGSVFPSATKPQAASIGIECLTHLCSGIAVPCVAIGGITADNVCQVYTAGAYAIAVISSIFDAQNVEGAVELLRL